MPNSRHIWVIGSPSRSRATKRRRSSITELAFHGIDTSRPKAESVTHVSGTKCHPCLGPLTRCRTPDTSGSSARHPGAERRNEGALPLPNSLSTASTPPATTLILSPVCPVRNDALVSGRSRDAELPTHLGHRLAIQEPSDETK